MVRPGGPPERTPHEPEDQDGSPVAASIDEILTATVASERAIGAPGRPWLDGRSLSRLVTATRGGLRRPILCHGARHECHLRQSIQEFVDER